MSSILKIHIKLLKALLFLSERRVYLFWNPFNPPYFCYLFLGGWYTYSKSHIKCDSCVFTIVGGVISIKAFNAANKVCSLVSSRVEPLYITSFCIWVFFNFEHTDGIHIICWVVCGWSFPWRSWDDILSSYAYRSSRDFCDAFIVLRPTPVLLASYNVFISSILLHYVELDTCTITTLEKLLGAGSFNGSINHLAHYWATFLSFLGRFGLLFLVQITTLTFLGWTLIVPALVTCFQQDNCPNLLDAIAHVEISTSSFQMTLRDVRAMLP